MQRALQLVRPSLDGGLLRCYTCNGVGAVDADVPFDPVADRGQWPELGCWFTLDCPGQVVPEALN